MEWNGIWHGIWNRFSSHNAATDGHTTYYSISSETTEGIDTRNSSLCAFIVQRSHSIHLPTRLQLNFPNETAVTEAINCTLNCYCHGIVRYRYQHTYKTIKLSYIIVDRTNGPDFFFISRLMQVVASVHFCLLCLESRHPHQGLKHSASVSGCSIYSIHRWNAVITMETSSSPPLQPLIHPSM